MIKIEKKRLQKAILLGILKKNPIRSVIIPLSIIFFIIVLNIPNKIQFQKINKIFKDNTGTMYYEMYDGDVIESEVPKFIFKNDNQSYLKTYRFGEGKHVFVFISFILLVFSISSIFAESLEIPDVIQKVIKSDIKIITIENKNTGGYEKIWTSYSKEIGPAYISKSMLDIPNTMEDMLSLPDVIDKPSIRNLKLEELGI
jgi:hypothetical protein